MNIEPLESRIAPAVLLAANGKSATYTDVDGDLVTITTSTGAFVFTHGPDGDFGDSFVFTTANADGGQQLIYVDLTLGGFGGADFTVSATKAGKGDGLAAVGLIVVPALGAVKIDGDLGAIDCGDNVTGLELLSVRSMGRYGLITQASLTDLHSEIRGSLGALQVAADIKDVWIDVTAAVNANATIGSVSIGGSVIGGSAEDSGKISADGGMGSVKIGRDLIGGDGFSSGEIFSDEGKIGNVTIGGSIIGGSNTNSGLLAGGELGAVKVGGNVKGGSEGNSGNIRGTGKIASVTIGGSLLGGSGLLSGSVLSNGDIGPVKIAHDVKGGAGDESGKIEAGGKLGTVTIGGSLLGGAGEYDTTLRLGQISALVGIGAVRIGHDVRGSADASGAIVTEGNLAGVTIGGSLLGGAGAFSGNLFARDSMGAVTIRHDIVGGVGGASGAIYTEGMLSSVTVGGSLVGGLGISSSKITFGDLGPVKIGRDLAGGSASLSGMIESTAAGGGSGTIAGVTIGGSLVGGSNFSTGVISSTGAISAAGTIAFVRIGHDLIGGSITGTTPALQESGIIESEGRIGSVSIGGSIIAGTDGSSGGGLDVNASIRAGDDIGSLTVRGGLIGSSSASIIISARGQATPGATTDLAIGKISIGGRVELAQIFAGYDDALVPMNADAQIGAVTVGGDWIASSIVAGAVNLGADDAPNGTGLNADNRVFGDGHDASINEMPVNTTILSRIASITIAGQVFGTPLSFSNADRFGFVAEQIGALKIGAATFALDPAGLDGRFLGRTGDMTLHEIGAGFLVSPVPTTSAKLINASTVTYDDIDGDHVTVKLSKPLLISTAVAKDVFTFNTGTVDDGVNARQQLQLIDLTSLAATGLSVTVTVTAGGGDRLANVGAILADDDLGTITVPGDLGRIVAGDASATIKGLGALNLRTFGRLGLDTQPAASATYSPFVGGEIAGGLGAFTVKQDFAGATFAVTQGGIGSLSIGGSLIGGTAAASGISTAQAIGAVKIGHHLQRGAGGSGFIEAGTSIASVSVGGSVIGTTINADGTTLGAVKIGHNVIGGIIDDAGRLSGNTGVGNVTIGGSLLGGLGNSSGQIFSAAGGTGAVTISHNVTGSAGDESGKIDSAGKLAGLTLGGSLVGGSGSQSSGAHDGQIFAMADIGAVTIGHDMLGNSASFSASIRSMTGSLGSVTIGGSVVGGVTSESASIASALDVGAVRIGHDVLGGIGIRAGAVFGGRNLGNVTIGGSLVGGSGGGNGQINGNASLGAVKIGHDVLGGSVSTSGYIVSNGKLTSVTIGGSLVGGSADLTGGIFPSDLGPVKIGRDLIGGSIAGNVITLTHSGFIESAHRIASVAIGGSIIAGIDDSTGGALLTNASIRAGDDLGALSVKGSLVGNVGDGTAANLSKVIISAGGQATLAANATLDLAIKSVSIGGRVERVQILAGYTPELTVHGPGSIGPVTVGGDWAASDLVAGVIVDDDPSAPNLFGDFDDIPSSFPGTAVVARIAAINIKGAVVGTEAPGDHFGFVAHVIGSFKSLGFTAPLTNNALPGAIHDVIELSPLTHDVTVREV